MDNHLKKNLDIHIEKSYSHTLEKSEGVLMSLIFFCVPVVLIGLKMNFISLFISTIIIALIYYNEKVIGAKNIQIG